MSDMTPGEVTIDEERRHLALAISLQAWQGSNPGYSDDAESWDAFTPQLIKTATAFEKYLGNGAVPE